jgi:hypothetical protein
VPRRSPRHGYNRTQASSSLRPALQWERHGKESSDMDTASTIIQHSAQIGITWPRAARQVRVVRRKPPAADRSAPRWSKNLQSAYGAGQSQPTRAALDKFDRAGWSGRPRSAGHSPGWVTECAARGRHLGAPPCVKKTPEAGRQRRPLAAVRSRETGASVAWSSMSPPIGPLPVRRSKSVGLATSKSGHHAIRARPLCRV